MKLGDKVIVLKNALGVKEGTKGVIEQIRKDLPENADNYKIRIDEDFRWLCKNEFKLIK